MALSEEEQDVICKDFNDVILKALDENAIQGDQASEMAGYFLGKLNAVNNKFELPNMFADIAGKWPMFSTLQTFHEGKVEEASEIEAAQGVTTLLQGGKIDEALSLAKHETHND